MTFSASFLRVGSIAVVALLGAVSSPSVVAGCVDAQGLGSGFHLGESANRTLDDYRLIRSMHGVTVRFGIALSACKGCDRYERPEAAISELRRNLDYAKQTGMRLVLVLRPPAEQDGELWRSAALQRSLAELWVSLAEQFQGRPELAAFDLVNEPHPEGRSFEAKQIVWDALAKLLITAIRKVDPNRVIVIEPSPGGLPMSFKYATPLPFPSLIYSMHLYQPVVMTHQNNGEPRFAGHFEYPGKSDGVSFWDKTRLREEMLPVKQFADRNHVPIWVGEFGVVRWAPGGARERYLQDAVDLFAENRWDWVYHAWREWDGWDAEMSSNPKDKTRRVSEPTLGVLKAALNTCEKPLGSR